ARRVQPQRRRPLRRRLLAEHRRQLHLRRALRLRRRWRVRLPAHGDRQLRHAQELLDRLARWRTIALLVLLVLAGFLIRCIYLREVFLDGRVLPFDPDSFYHLWRIEQTAHTGATP